MHTGVKRNTKRIGDLSELQLMHDLVPAGYLVSIPIGEDHRYDLVVEKDGFFSRVQVKRVEPAKNGQRRKLRWASRYLLFAGTAQVGKGAVDAVTARALPTPL